MKIRTCAALFLVVTWLAGGSIRAGYAQQPARPAQRVVLDLAQVRQQLLPLANRSGQPATYRLQLPTPTGPQPLVLTETFVLPATDAAARQRLRTFVGYQATDPTRHVALTLTARALTAQLLRGPEALLLHPAPDGRAYLLEKPAAPAPSNPCGTVSAAEPAQRLNNASTLPAPGSFGSQLRTVRMAILVTAEFYAANKGSDSHDDQNVETAVATIMNGMTAFYQRELAVSFTLVKPTNGAYYFSAMTTSTLPKGDPPTAGRVRDSNPGDVRDINLVRFAAGTYDLGHGLHNTGGGVAFEPAICSGNRGGGWSGASPSGNFQQVLAHEIGHQFGAGHAFNGPCGSQEVGSNLEPGGGASVMAYPYVCNVQNLLLGPTDEDHFSLRALDKMRARLLSANCPGTDLSLVASANHVPVVQAGADYVIPTQTPFTLTAAGNDPDGDALLYTWDQFDYTANVNALGTIAGTGGLAAIDDPEAPLFRPRLPSAANARTFPALPYILANSNQPPDRVGEALSRVGRDLHFGVTVRDQATGGGAWASDNVTVTVAPNTGPFALTTQNVASLWVTGQSATVTWSVNGTDQAPIGVGQVRITLSTDGGQTFPTVLAASTPNDGSFTLLVPNVTTSQARVRVEAVGNIFFDINDVDFPIGPCAPVASQLLPATDLSANAGDAALNLPENAYSLTELTGANKIQGTITATDPTTYLSDNRTSTCVSYSNVEYYDSYVFVPSTTDTYTISTPTGFGNLVIRVYDSNGFVPGTPCQNAVANNYTNAFLPRSIVVPLTAGRLYTLVLADFGGGTPHAAPSPGGYSVAFTSATPGGTAYAPLGSAGYEYQYAVVATASNTVVQLAPTADLRNLPTGTYEVYGVLFQRGYDLSGSRNNSLSSLQALLTNSSPCGQLSANSRRVTITGNPLPVVLTSFSGQATESTTVLHWNTASEQDVAYFDVQRSPDRTFTRLERVAATNTNMPHAYTLTDWLPPTGLAYYRLLLQDQDGSRRYSPAVAVSHGSARELPAFALQAFPNPVPTGATVQLQVQTREAQLVHLSLTDAVGRTVWQQTVALPVGSTQLSLPGATPHQGLYLLTAQPATGAPVQQKVLF